MRKALLVVLITGNVMAVRLDPHTGLWFPPDAPPSEDLAMKAAYAADVKRAFSKDPQLARQVCKDFQARVANEEVPQSIVGQYMVLLTTQCAAVAVEASMQPQRQQSSQHASNILGKMLDDAIVYASGIPEPQRRPLHEQTLNAAEQSHDSQERLQLAMRAIALRPQNSRGAHLLLVPDGAGDSGPFTPALLGEFVEDAYRDRVSDPLWESGLAEVLLYRGKLDEARRLQKEQVERGNAAYDRAALAVMDEMAGEKGAIAAMDGGCDADCWYVAYSIALRTVDALGAKAPPGTSDVLLAISRNSADAGVKIATGRALTKLDPALAMQENAALANAPGASNAAVIDAIRSLAEAAHASGDVKRGIALLDCWMERRFGAFPPFPDDGWQRVAARLRTPDNREEKECEADPDAAMCIYGALLRRMHWSLAIGRRDLAQQSLEMLGARIIDGRMKASKLPPLLMTMAAELRMRNDPEMLAEANTIAAWVGSLPHDETTAHNLKSYPKSRSIVALAPFSAAAEIRDLPVVCRAGALFL